MTEIVVTGSRIPQPNLTSVSPITSVNAQDIKLAGTSNVEDLIDSLPQAVGDFGNYESNGATGTSTIDLRGLGNKRTLVLVNGTRLMPGDPTVGDQAADIDIIPPSLIDRVEVLTGGASAVYGSDAIAGVVNFILKTHFQGLQIDEQTVVRPGRRRQSARRSRRRSPIASTSSASHRSINFPARQGRRLRQTVTITGGVNSPDDKGNAEFYFGYTYIQAVTEGQRDLLRSAPWPPTTPAPACSTAAVRLVRTPDRAAP